MSAVAYDDIGSARTSAAVVVKIQALTNSPSTILASDSFHVKRAKKRLADAVIHLHYCADVL